MGNVLGIHQRLPTPDVENQTLKDAIKAEMHCAIPAIVTGFDPEEQTISAIPAVTYRAINNAGNEEYVKFPEIQDIPVLFPGGAGLFLTFPISIGDECLLIFCDTDFSAWWANGAWDSEKMEVIPQNQEQVRFHALSDAVALIGLRSNKNQLKDFNTVSPEIRNIDGTAKVSFAIDGTILIKGTQVIIEEG